MFDPATVATKAQRMIEKTGLDQRELSGLAEPTYGSPAPRLPGRPREGEHNRHQNHNRTRN
jgi:hypothetical protein